VAGVRFYAGLTFLGEDATPPYSFDWSGMTNGSYTLTAKAVYDGANLVSSLAATITVTNGNHPPVPGPAVFLGARLNQPATLDVSRLIAIATDPDNDPLTVIAAGPASTNGGTVSLVCSHITYTPAAGYVGPDSFTYTLSDGRGGAALGTVTVSVSNGQSFNRVSIGTLNGNALVTFYGIPSGLYSMDWTHSLTPPIAWLPLRTNPASGTGLLLFTNPPSGGNDYYRTRFISAP
jgi:hypothetical protein